MEELKQMDMLEETLSERFNTKQWLRIRTQSHQLFQKKQQKTLQRLLGDPKLFARKFGGFYDNHVRLLNWSVLAVENKAEICEYVFKDLVNRGNQFYIQKMQTALEHKLLKKKEAKDGFDLKDIQHIEHDVYKEIFEEMVSKKNKNLHEFQVSERPTIRHR